MQYCTQYTLSKPSPSWRHLLCETLKEQVLIYGLGGNANKTVDAATQTEEGPPILWVFSFLLLWWSVEHDLADLAAEKRRGRCKLGWDYFYIHIHTARNQFSGLQEALRSLQESLDLFTLPLRLLYPLYFVVFWQSIKLTLYMGGKESYKDSEEQIEEKRPGGLQGFFTLNWNWTWK